MFDFTYLIFAMPALLLGLYAQFKVRSAYEKYSQVRNSQNITGGEAAQALLRAARLSHVGIGETPGTLTDHYDPRQKRLNLSVQVARVPSVAAIGIVAHEVGHAMQDSEGYVPLKLRAAMVPVVQIGSWIGPILFLIGLLLALTRLATVGLVLFSATALFSLVTLPVEFNASNRAVALLTASRIITSEEEKQAVRQVLNGAALTYVAAAAQSISTIFYYVFLLGGRRRR